MRAVVATGIALTLAALAGGAQAREVSIYRGKCGEAVLPVAPAGLPRAVDLATDCGAFRVGRAGEVIEIGRASMVDRDPLDARARQTIVIHDPVSGVKTVLLDEPGEGRTRPLFSHHTRSGLWFGNCSELPLEWHDSWLLYRSRDGHLVAMESRTLELVDLTATVSRLPGELDAADWA